MHQLLYITCASHDEAQRIAHHLLKSRLIACANLLPPMTSYFHWDGQIQHSEEVILIAKSVKEHFSTIEAQIKDIHSYDCPCILAFDVSSAHMPFLQWISAETSKKAS